MKSLYAALAILCASPAFATTFTFDLRFESDFALELQSSFYDDTSCSIGQECYPSDFRLSNGYFADLQPGDIVTAEVNLEEGTAKIGDFSIFGNLVRGSDAIAEFLSNDPMGITRFEADKVTFINEGPRGLNPGAICNPGQTQPGLPDGFCGFFGYQANFTVLSVTDSSLSVVPLPAGGLLLFSGLGLFVFALRRRSRT